MAVYSSADITGCPIGCDEKSASTLPNDMSETSMRGACVCSVPFFLSVACAKTSCDSFVGGECLSASAVHVKVPFALLRADLSLHRSFSALRAAAAFRVASIDSCRCTSFSALRAAAAFCAASVAASF